MRKQRYSPVWTFLGEKGLPPGFMRRVRIANVKARGIGNLGSSVSTFEEGRISGVRLENISIETVGGIRDGDRPRRGDPHRDRHDPPDGCGASAWLGGDRSLAA